MVVDSDGMWLAGIVDVYLFLRLLRQLDDVNLLFVDNQLAFTGLRGNQYCLDGIGKIFDLSFRRSNHLLQVSILDAVFDITIGDTDINQLNRKWWRRQCGVVMQEGVIFSESIARNIAVDDAEIDEARLMIAAEIACIKDYVMALPLKFNTKIGRDGVGLSQGQKQRILIARAVYKNPDYIFLDEATNSLDANNERNIVENLDKFYQGKTVVIVAHRLSTVKNADQIVVLDQGKVVEVGNHESLTAKRGAYYNLVKNQLELGN